MPRQEDLEEIERGGFDSSRLMSNFPVLTAEICKEIANSHPIALLRLLFYHKATKLSMISPLFQQWRHNMCHELSGYHPTTMALVKLAPLALSTEIVLHLMFCPGFEYMLAIRPLLEPLHRAMLLDFFSDNIEPTPLLLLVLKTLKACSINWRQDDILECFNIPGVNPMLFDTEYASWKAKRMTLLYDYLSNHISYTCSAYQWAYPLSYLIPCNLEEKLSELTLPGIMLALCVMSADFKSRGKSRWAFWRNLCLLPSTSTRHSQVIVFQIMFMHSTSLESLPLELDDIFFHTLNSEVSLLPQVRLWLFSAPYSYLLDRCIKLCAPLLPSEMLTLLETSPNYLPSILAASLSMSPPNVQFVALWKHTSSPKLRYLVRVSAHDFNLGYCMDNVPRIMLSAAKDDPDMFFAILDLDGIISERVRFLRYIVSAWASSRSMLVGMTANNALTLNYTLQRIHEYTLVDCQSPKLIEDLKWEIRQDCQEFGNLISQHQFPDPHPYQVPCQPHNNENTNDLLGLIQLQQGIPPTVNFLKRNLPYAASLPFVAKVITPRSLAEAVGSRMETGKLIDSTLYSFILVLETIQPSTAQQVLEFLPIEFPILLSLLKSSLFLASEKSISSIISNCSEMDRKYIITRSRRICFRLLEECCQELEIARYRPDVFVDFCIKSGSVEPCFRVLKTFLESHEGGCLKYVEEIAREFVYASLTEGKTTPSIINLILGISSIVYNVDFSLSLHVLLACDSIVSPTSLSWISNVVFPERLPILKSLCYHLTSNLNSTYSLSVVSRLEQSLQLVPDLARKCPTLLQLLELKNSIPETCSWINEFQKDPGCVIEKNDLEFHYRCMELLSHSDALIAESFLELVLARLCGTSQFIIKFVQYFGKTLHEQIPFSGTRHMHFELTDACLHWGMNCLKSRIRLVRETACWFLICWYQWSLDSLRMPTCVPDIAASWSKVKSCGMFSSTTIEVMDWNIRTKQEVE